MARIPRIYYADELLVNHTATITGNAAGHLARVLRLNLDDKIMLFNGDSHQYLAKISQIEKKKVLALVTQQHQKNIESPLNIHLGQVISRGERMDYTLQKAVELGVQQITPLLSERCGVKLNPERQAKRLQHWHGIIISACEQSGRNTLPLIHPIQTLADWFDSSKNALNLVLNPVTNLKLAQLNCNNDKVSLLVGPEGGLTEAEIHQAHNANFISVKLGPRVLRTETAGLAAIVSIQTLWGDF